MRAIRTTAPLVLAGLAIGVSVLYLTPEAKPVADGKHARAVADPGRLPEQLDGKPAPRIRLADARGGAIDTRDLKGKPYVVTFLYTRCTGTCPLIARELTSALDMLGPKGRDTAVVAVSVDPAGDTRKAVLSWLDRMGAPENFHYAIGTGEELAPIWRRYYVGPQGDAGADQSIHTAAIWLVDRRGLWRRKYPAAFPVDPAKIAADLAAMVAERP